MASRKKKGGRRRGRPKKGSARDSISKAIAMLHHAKKKIVIKAKK